jgi:curli biogenesis system outer membrane secretion channel CsgG
MAYASPECFDGTTSEHSDQYSLAVTFCQLCCGRPPFEGTPVAVMNGHRTQQPDLSCVPVPQRPAITKALAKLPKDRWESCSEFVSHLFQPTSVRTPPPAIVAESAAANSRSMFVACMIFVTLLIGGVWALLPATDVVKSPPTGEPLSPTAEQLPTESERPRLAVLYFEDQSTDTQSNRALSKGLCSMMTTGLSDSGEYEVVERARLQAVLDELKLTRADTFDQQNVVSIGKLLGAKQLMLGSYFEILDTFRIDARLVEVETGVTVKAAGVEGRAEDFSVLVAQLVSKLKGASRHKSDSRSHPSNHERAVSVLAVEVLGTAAELLDEGTIEAAGKIVDELLIKYPHFHEARVLRGDLDRLSCEAKVSPDHEARGNEND